MEGRATVTVRQLDPDVVKKLKVIAATNNRSMEAEIRDALHRLANGEVLVHPLAAAAASPAREAT